MNLEVGVLVDGWQNDDTKDSVIRLRVSSHKSTAYHICLYIAQVLRQGEDPSDYALFELRNNCFRIIPFQTVLGSFMSKIKVGVKLAFRLNPLYFDRISKIEFKSQFDCLDSMYSEMLFRVTLGHCRADTVMEAAKIAAISYLVQNPEIESSDDIQLQVLSNWISMHHVSSLCGCTGHPAVLTQALVSCRELIDYSTSRITLKTMYVHTVAKFNASTFLSEYFTCDMARITIARDNDDGGIDDFNSVSSFRRRSVSKHSRSYRHSSNSVGSQAFTARNSEYSNSISLEVTWFAVGMSGFHILFIDDNRPGEKSNMLDGSLKLGSGIGDKDEYLLSFKFQDIHSFSASSEGTVLAISLATMNIIHLTGIVNGWGASVIAVLSLYKKMDQIVNNRQNHLRQSLGVPPVSEVYNDVVLSEYCICDSHHNQSFITTAATRISASQDFESERKQILQRASLRTLFLAKNNFMKRFIASSFGTWVKSTKQSKYRLRIRSIVNKTSLQILHALKVTVFHQWKVAWLKSQYKMASENIQCMARCLHRWKIEVLNLKHLRDMNNSGLTSKYFRLWNRNGGILRRAKRSKRCFTTLNRWRRLLLAQTHFQTNERQSARHPSVVKVFLLAAKQRVVILQQSFASLRNFTESQKVVDLQFRFGNFVVYWESYKLRQAIKQWSKFAFHVLVMRRMYSLSKLLQFGAAKKKAFNTISVYSRYIMKRDLVLEQALSSWKNRVLKVHFKEWQNWKIRVAAMGDALFKMGLATLDYYFHVLKTNCDNLKHLERVLWKMASNTRILAIRLRFQQWKESLKTDGIFNLDCLITGVHRRMMLTRGVNSWKMFVMVQSISQSAAISKLIAIFDDYVNVSKKERLKKCIDHWRYVYVSCYNVDHLSSLVDQIVKRLDMKRAIGCWKQFIVLMDIERSYALEVLSSFFHQYSETYRKECLKAAMDQWRLTFTKSISVELFAAISERIQQRIGLQHAVNKWKRYVLARAAEQNFATSQITKVFSRYENGHNLKLVRRAFEKILKHRLYTNFALLDFLIGRINQKRYMARWRNYILGLSVEKGFALSQLGNIFDTYVRNSKLKSAFSHWKMVGKNHHELSRCIVKWKAAIVSFSRLSIKHHEASLKSKYLRRLVRNRFTSVERAQAILLLARFPRRLYLTNSMRIWKVVTALSRFFGHFCPRMHLKLHFHAFKTRSCELYKQQILSQLFQCQQSILVLERECASELSYARIHWENT